MLSGRTQICSYRDSFPKKGSSQNGGGNIENNSTVTVHSLFFLLV